MSIEVDTEVEVFEFVRGVRYSVDNDGYLTVFGVGNDKLATFASGRWASARTVASPEPEPEVVDALTVELLADRAVWADVDGDQFKLENGWFWRRYPDRHSGWLSLFRHDPTLPLTALATEYGPYTRVLEKL